MDTHWIFDKRVQIYKRGDSRVWYCATRIEGERFRASTGEENLARATAVAEEWYLDLRGKLHNPTARLGAVEPAKPVKKERTFAEACDAYLREVSVLAISNRSPQYVSSLTYTVKRHILPYFGSKPLSAINRGMVQAYRVHRAEETIERTRQAGIKRALKAKRAREENEQAELTDEEIAAIAGYPPARSTMLQQIVHIRQILKYAEGNGWIPFVPSLAMPYMTQGKKGRRAWFAPDEYQQLYEATASRAKDCPRRGWQSEYEYLHDYVLFMANTGLRPDEASALELRDVKVERDHGTKQTILVIDVRGKTGVGYCKSTEKAVYPFERIVARRRSELPDDLDDATAAKILATTKLFPKFRRNTFNNILQELGLKFDRDGKRRTAYSLRHTYISMRLMEGANIHQIANNCRTSVQMIEEHYASHIKDRLDASAINVRRRGARRKDGTPPQPPKKAQDNQAASA